MKKNYEKIIIYLILFLAIFGAIFTFIGLPTNMAAKLKNMPNEIGSNELGYKSIDSGSTGSGDVSIELTPLGIEDNQFKVEVAVNTHSVDLSQFNLKEITTLEYNGKSVNPVSAPGLDGHHSSGEIVFDIGEETDSFTIKIKGIPKVEERVFAWEWR